jgi:hypothetical protein
MRTYLNADLDNGERTSELPLGGSVTGSRVAIARSSPYSRWSLSGPRCGDRPFHFDGRPAGHSVACGAGGAGGAVGAGVVKVLSRP